MAKLTPGAIELRGVSRKFKVIHDRSATLKETLIRRKRAHYTELWALRDVSLDIAPGESVALVGRNGSGKSTLLKMLAGIIPPHAGTIRTGGSVASMLELGSGFHPDFTGRENVFMNGAIHGLSERTVNERLDEIVEFAELRDFIDMPVRTYSSGMQMRLAFAVAAHVNPDILLLDEVLAVGDAAFQGKCTARIGRFLDDGGTLVFVSHSAASVKEVCTRAILMDSGVVRADGHVNEVMSLYDTLVMSGEGHAGGEFLDADGHRLDSHSSQPQDKSVTITSLTLRTRDGGGIAGPIETGSLVEADISFTCARDVQPLDVALYLTNSKMQEVLAICSSEGGVEIAGTAGSYRCSTTMRLPLQEDLIRITAFVRSHPEGVVFDERTAGEPLRIRRSVPGQGVIATAPEWSLSATAIEPGHTVQAG